MTTLNVTTLAQVQLNQVIEQLNNEYPYHLIEIYNDCADSNGYERIYDNDDDTINDLYQDASDVLRAAFFGDYNHSHNYFTLNGCANLQSFEYVDSEHSPIDIEELAQWLLDEDKADEYEITVTTLEDMLTSIEDNITDDENMLSKLVSYLNLSLYSEDEVLNDGNDWDEYRIEQCMDWLNTSYDYNQLNDIITHLNINYN